MTISRRLSTINKFDNPPSILSFNEYTRGVVDYLGACLLPFRGIDIQDVNSLQNSAFSVIVGYMHGLSFTRILFGDNKAVSIREYIEPDRRYKN